MWCYTLSLDAESLKEAVEDLTNKANTAFKKTKPFRIIVEEEPMKETLGESMGGSFVRFSLAVTPNFTVKNERQAMRFCQLMKEAAEEVEKMNAANYVLVPPADRRGGPRGGAFHA